MGGRSGDSGISSEGSSTATTPNSAVAGVGDGSRDRRERTTEVYDVADIVSHEIGSRTSPEEVMRASKGEAERLLRMLGTSVADSGDSSIKVSSSGNTATLSLGNDWTVSLSRGTDGRWKIDVDVPESTKRKSSRS